MTERVESVTYIARASCGCVKVAMATYLGTKLPADWTARLMDAVADGCTLETVSTEWMRANFTSRCDECDPPKPV
jgi:hypothetical protein